MKRVLAAVLAAFLCSLSIMAPVMAVPTKPGTAEEAEFTAACKAGGGCFVVTEEGFKKAMVIAFQNGHEVGTQIGYQYGRNACKVLP